MRDKQLEQWNVQPPLLYLWSRPDWTSRHNAVAQKCGHISMGQKDFFVKGNNVEREVSNYLMEENLDCYGDFSKLMKMKDSGDIPGILDNIPEDNNETEPEGTRNSISGPSFSTRSSEGKDKVTSMEQCGISETEHGDDGMCTDMEISSPDDSTFGSTDVVKSLLEDKAHEVEVGRTSYGDLQQRPIEK